MKCNLNYIEVIATNKIFTFQNISYSSHMHIIISAKIGLLL